jgi:hypothetical protein
MTIVIISAVAVLSSGAIVAVAMGRVAARADAELDELLSRRLGTLAARELHESYAGFALAQRAISRDPSTTVPSSSTSVGTQRLPVSSSTSRRPRVWLNTPGSGANP